MDTINILGAFLLATFTAYFTLLEKKSDNIFLSIILSIVGILFSILWVCMAKASKTNQEIYEAKIAVFRKKYKLEICDNPDEFYKETGISPNMFEFRKNMQINRNKVREFLGGQNDKDLKIKNPDDKIFSVEGGYFSVSKINIAIGIIFLLFWISAFIFIVYNSSIILILKKLSTVLKISLCDFTMLVLFGFIIFLAISSMVRLIISKITSSYLKGVDG